MLVPLVTLLLSQSPAPTANATATAAATVAAPTVVLKARRVLVLDPASESIPAETRRAIGSLLVGELGKNTDLEVLSANELQKMADLEAQKQAAGCDSASCLSELAGAIGAELVVFGDAAKLGSLTLVNLSLFDAAKAKAVQRAQVQVERPEDMPQKIAEAAHKLFPAGANVAASTSSDTPGKSIWLPVSLIAGGALVGIVAGIVDLASPTSHNGRLDGVDFVGPVGYAAGIVGVAAGAALWPE